MAANNRRKVGGLKPIIVVPQFLFPVLKKTHILLTAFEIDHSDSFLGNREQSCGIQGLHQDLIEVYQDPVYQKAADRSIPMLIVLFLALN